MNDRNSLAGAGATAPGEAGPGAAQPVVLPHTGISVPHTRLTLRKLRSIPTSDGEAYTAELLLDGRAVGVIENTGTGGPTTWLPSSRLHRHADCGEAAARITWAVAEKTIAMVTGEVGTGKTVAIRAAVADLDPAAHTIIYIGNPSTGVRGILAHVVTALGGRPVHGTAALAVQAWNTLAGEAAERGRTPVLIIDEAHLLDHDQLESIRMMTNHDMDSSTPFATILVGQPTLRHSVKLGVLAALEQRITVRYQLKGMTPDETASYIRHHLDQAGRATELFTDEAITQIHQAARGKPRTVNNIATAALIATAGAGKNLVDHASARAAIAEVTATD